MWPRHCSNKASHNGRTPGTLDGWIAWDGVWCYREWGPGRAQKEGAWLHWIYYPPLAAITNEIQCAITYALYDTCKSVVRFVSLSFSSTRFYSTVMLRTSSWLSMLDPFVVLGLFHFIQNFSVFFGLRFSQLLHHALEGFVPGKYIVVFERCCTCEWLYCLVIYIRHFYSNILYWTCNTYIHARTHINARKLNEFIIRCLKNNYGIS